MNRIGKTIGGSFAAVSLLFFGMAVVTLIQINRVVESSRRIQNILEPSIQSNLRMNNAIQLSHASLLEWLHFKDEKSARRRKNAWSIIDKSLTRLTNYSKNWEDSENIAILEKIGENLNSLSSSSKSRRSRTFPPWMAQRISYFFIWWIS